MKRRFKSRKKKSLLKSIIIIGVILFVFVKTFNYLLAKKLKIEIDNAKFINYLLYTGSDGRLGDNEIYKVIGNLNLRNPSNMIQQSLNNYLSIDQMVFEESEEEYVDMSIEHFEDPNRRNISEPLVYIYNSHQKEAYYSKYKLEYNITPTVLMASYILKEKLNDLGVKTIVEERDITEILRTNSWPYRYSYKASKMLIEDVLEKNKSIRYIIDLHRDSSARSKTIAEIDGALYARVLFVVGLEHDNYESNLKIADDLNNLIINKNKSLSRGITKKSGSGVNGIYNQDLHANAVLLEMGGQYNTIEEVNNTINIIAPIISGYIKEMEHIAE